MGYLFSVNPLLKAARQLGASFVLSFRFPLLRTQRDTVRQSGWNSHEARAQDAWLIHIVNSKRFETSSCSHRYSRHVHVRGAGREKERQKERTPRTHAHMCALCGLSRASVPGELPFLPFYSCVFSSSLPLNSRVNEQRSLAFARRLIFPPGQFRAAASCSWCMATYIRFSSRVSAAR